jgi:hypothetical protein
VELPVLAAGIDTGSLDVYQEPLVDQPAQPGLIQASQLNAGDDGAAAALDELAEQG